MPLDKDSLFFIVMAIFVFAFLVAILPLKNWLEIKLVKKKELRWVRWLNEKPSKKQYCEIHQQNPKKISCDFCGASRHLPSLEMVIVNQPKFGFINNTFSGYSYFKTHICSGCGTELFRERYEE